MINFDFDRQKMLDAVREFQESQGLPSSSEPAPDAAPTKASLSPDVEVERQRQSNVFDRFAEGRPAEAGGGPAGGDLRAHPRLRQMLESGELDLAELRRAGINPAQLQALIGGQGNTPAPPPAAPADPDTAPRVDYNVPVQIPNPQDKAQLQEYLGEHWQQFQNTNNLDEILPGHPPGKVVINWRGESIHTSLQYGEKTGALTPEIKHDIGRAAHALLGFEGQVPSGAKRQLNDEAILTAIFERVPPEMIDGSQLMGALNYVKGATDAADQVVRLSAVMQATWVHARVGGPPVSDKQMREELWAFNQNIPGHALKYSTAELRQKYDEINQIQSIPGKHSVKLRSSQTYKIENDDNGVTTSEQVKKKSFWSKVGDAVKKALPIVLTILSFIPVTAPFAIAANAALNAYNGVKNGNWLQAVVGVAGAVAGVAGGFTSAVAGKVVNVASKVASYAGNAQAALNAYKAAKQGNWLGAIAGAASAVSGFVKTSANSLAGVAGKVVKWADRVQMGANTAAAAKRGDYLGAAAIGANLGRSFAVSRGLNDGTLVQNKHGQYVSANPSVPLSGGARALNILNKVDLGAQYGGAVQNALENGDYAGAAATLAGAIDHLKNGPASARDPEDVTTLSKIANSLAGVGQAQQLIDQGRYLEAAGILTAAGSQFAGKAGERMLSVGQDLANLGGAYARIENGDYIGAAASLQEIAAGHLDGPMQQKLLEGAKAFEAARGLPQLIDSGNYLEAAHLMSGVAAAYVGDPQVKARLQKASSALDKAGDAYSAFRRGDYGEAAASLLEAADVYVGDRATKKKLAEQAAAMQQAASAEGLIESGDFAGAAKAFAAAAEVQVGDASSRSRLSQFADALRGAGRAHQLIEAGDYGGAAAALAGAASKMVGNERVQQRLLKFSSSLSEANTAYQAVEAGDYASALESLSRIAANHSSGSRIGRRLDSASGLLETAGAAQRAISSGDYGKAASLLFGEAAKRASGDRLGGRLENAASGLEKAGDLQQAIESQNWPAAVDAAKDLHAWVRDSRPSGEAAKLGAEVDQLQQALVSGDAASIARAGQQLAKVADQTARKAANAEVAAAGEITARAVLDDHAGQLLGSGQPYAVQAGDTLWDLARRYGTTVSKIQAANGNALEPRRLQIGQQIKIPVGAEQFERANQAHQARLEQVAAQVMVQRGDQFPDGLRPAQVREIAVEQGYLEQQAAADQASGWSWSDIGHTALDVAGIVPGVGEAADLANAAWYAKDGKYLDAGFAMVSMIPGVGDLIGKGGKYLLRGGKKLARPAAKRLLDLLGKIDIRAFFRRFKNHPKLGPMVAKIEAAVVKWVDELKALAGKIPQGFTSEQFEFLSSKISDRARQLGLGDDIVVQGSRAAGTAAAKSDVDVAILLPKSEFDRFLRERFKSVNPGSAKERTMLHAIATGKIQSGEAGLRSLRKELEAFLGIEVDVSVILKGGPFDNPPTIPVG